MPGLVNGLPTIIGLAWPSKAVPAASLRLLCNLRWLAVMAQAATVIVATGPLGLMLDVVQLWCIIAGVAMFNVYATWRAGQQSSPTNLEVFIHVFIDIAALTGLIAWGGGADNPFASLFLLPIALTVTLLPPPWGWSTAAACFLGYAISSLFGPPLPQVHSAMGDAFALHKLGMMANFLVSSGVILLFLQQMLAAARAHEQELGLLREKYIRNEGILALATHAASVAHELNTPLGTLMLMVEDSRHHERDSERSEELATMWMLLEQCRLRVRELARPADGMPIVNLHQMIERWQRVRPTIELRCSGSTRGLPHVDAAVGHLLQVLLNNAADASEAAGARCVELELNCDQQGLHGAIRDYGVAAAEITARPKLFSTRKPNGMGVGLALSCATVERLGGELSMRAEAQGTCVIFRLPAAVAA